LWIRALFYSALGIAARSIRASLVAQRSHVWRLSWSCHLLSPRHLENYTKLRSQTEQGSVLLMDTALISWIPRLPSRFPLFAFSFGTSNQSVTLSLLSSLSRTPRALPCRASSTWWSIASSTPTRTASPTSLVLRCPSPTRSRRIFWTSTSFPLTHSGPRQTFVTSQHISSTSIASATHNFAKMPVGTVLVTG
jgi:hypothetical protein